MGTAHRGAAALPSPIAWDGYLGDLRRGITTGSHLPYSASKMATTAAALLDGQDYTANSSDYPYEYLDEEDYMLYGLCTKEEVVSFSKMFLPAFYTVIFLVGFTGNVLLFTVLMSVSKKKMTEVYLLNLVVSDFLLLLTLPFWALFISQWVTWDPLCPVLNAMYIMNFYSGIFFVSCMSLDVYLQIVHACSPLSSKIRKSFLILLVAWVLSILLSIPDALFSSTKEMHNKTVMCTHDYGQKHLFWKVVFQVTQNIVGFLVPFLFMVYCYSHSVCVLTTSRVPGSRRALCFIFTLVAVFFVLWFPYNIVLILHSLQYIGLIQSCEKSRQLDYAIQITESLSFIHCCLNPVLYAFVKKRFRLYLWKIPQAFCRKSTFDIRLSETSHSCSRFTAQIEMLSINNT
ncbi:atypical chemokine receptor 2 [Cyrtonyx montezumae]|uniref:atypical chemokine receptor 2 n=1 Tax=Cyrtonyx montezumae TaxID=9017 RepID=UPI0032D9C62D